MRRHGGTLPSRPPIILIVAAVANSSHRRMVEGVIEYCDRVATWETLFVAGDVDYNHFKSQVDAADGVIAAPTTPAHLDYLRTIKAPTVLMGFGSQDFPYVHPDELAIGRMAFEHYRELGLRNFAFCGMPSAEFSEMRGKGFVQAAKEAGFGVNCYPRPVYLEMHKDEHEWRPFHAWLHSLPAPTGVFTAVSELAAVVVHHCRVEAIQIPEQLAVLGVDDDEIVCNVTHPRLSAIDQAPERMGYEAAAMLDGLLQGGKAPDRPLMIAPRAVIARGSTDLVNTDNASIAAAIRFIRTHVEEGISVGHVLKAVPMSRRGLERGFLRNVGRTIHDEIVRSRVERARYLLDHTEMPLPDIAARCGFSYPSKLSAVFKRVTGTSPSVYRRRRTGE